MANDRRALLEGETALITGGGRGIGLAIANAFALAGASVAIVARSSEELATAAREISAAGGRVFAHCADVTDEAAMTRVVENVRMSTGPITVLVNNAGSIGPIAPFGEPPFNDWWRCVEVNLRGPALCTQLVVHDMVARGRGRIINLVSGAGAASFTYFSAYVASKTAAVRWTECLAAELEPYGVQAFAMEPGTTVTAMSSFSLASAEGRRWIPWFKGIFDKGLDSPIEVVADRAVALAAGTADSLSGRYIPLTEDLSHLVSHAPRIRQDTMYSLRLSRLPAATTPERSVALRAARAVGEVASPRVVRMRRRLPVTAARAYDLWRDGKAVGSWFLPAGTAQWLDTPTMDPVAGGTFSLRMVASGEKYHVHGTVVAAVPDTRLTLDWKWESTATPLGSGTGTTVTIEFLPVQDNVDVVITHDGLSGEAVRDTYIRGWRRCLEGMERVTTQ